MEGKENYHLKEKRKLNFKKIEGKNVAAVTTNNMELLPN